MIYLRSVDPFRNRRRHYLLVLGRDLWGKQVLLRCWGRIGRPWQGWKTVVVQGEEEAGEEMERVMRRRRQHGYEVVQWTLCDTRAPAEAPFPPSDPPLTAPKNVAQGESGDDPD